MPGSKFSAHCSPPPPTRAAALCPDPVGATLPGRSAEAAAGCFRQPSMHWEILSEGLGGLRSRLVQAPHLRRRSHSRPAWLPSQRHAAPPSWRRSSGTGSASLKPASSADSAPPPWTWQAPRPRWACRSTKNDGASTGSCRLTAAASLTCVCCRFTSLCGLLMSQLRLQPGVLLERASCQMGAI